LRATAAGDIDTSPAHSASNADPANLPKQSPDMMLPLNRVARSYEAPTGQAIGASRFALPDAMLLCFRFG